MSKFKVGDEVIASRNGECSPVKAGMHGTITAIYGDVFTVKWDELDGEIWTSTDNGMKKSTTIYASDLMNEARKNPEKYEGKRYKAVNPAAFINVITNAFPEEIKVSRGKLFSKTGEGVAIMSCAELEEIKPVPVSFMEAVKALADSKTIRCETETYGDQIYRNGDLESQGGAVRPNEVLNGKWYIDE